MSKTRLGLAIVLAGASIAQAALHQVNVGNNFFSPSNLSIIQGDQVRWVRTAGTHTTTSNTGLWDATLDASNTSFMRTFNSVGTFQYFCDFHGSMDGVINVDPAAGIFDEPGTGSGVPSAYALRQNSPNPFNAATQIEYGLEEDGMVQLAVYNILGQHVITLVEEFQASGLHTVTWDGRDRSGNDTPSGIYFARMLTANVLMTRKMVLLR